MRYALHIDGPRLPRDRCRKEFQIDRVEALAHNHEVEVGGGYGSSRRDGAVLVDARRAARDGHRLDVARRAFDDRAAFLW